MDFPIYRKYKGIDVMFKIKNLKQFTEIKKMGNKLIESEVIANIYPEMQFINDMIQCYEDRWESISELEYTTFKSTNI
ncbi:hypothetical protein DNU06_11415 [Putridiphycobacter roseus]|uniref:Uncharacterized protein n=1 Tax=Putridiphycobacter roseus TaxID=2219161 RepID=A0A2W1NQE2_9FLAO|nr:hypothetical protein [Putridiphycobacter roseus]PZE16858.1 hypothetical protein DNU06_11415 [Putridiphycobacter roseus]